MIQILLFTWLLSIFYVPESIGLFSVSPLVVDTMDASSIALYWFCSSHLPAYLYIFRIFYKHICSYRSLFLNNFPIPMVDMCCFSCYYCNTPLKLTHFCSSYSILIIVLAEFFKSLYLSHCATCVILPSVWKQRYYFPG